MTQDNTYDLIKADVLAGMSGYAAAMRHGADSLKYAKRLASDPDIVAAKASGAMKDRAKWRHSPSHYRKLPHVVDVLDNGMTQSEAAEKYGISQPLVSRHVKQALDGQPMIKAARRSAPPPTTPTTDPEIDAIHALIKACATRRNLTTKQVLQLLDK